MSFDEAEVPDWSNGKCYTNPGDPEGFFPVIGTAQRQALAAKSVCNGTNDGVVCPERTKCLEYALRTNERFGVWGGMSERDRMRERRRRVSAAEQAKQEREERRIRRAAASRKAWDTRRRNARAAGKKKDAVA